MFKNILSDISQPVPNGKGKIETIDLLRGLASIIILIVHYKHFYMGPDFIRPDITIDGLYFYDAYSPIMQYGANAVQLFWVISGFVFIHVYGGSLKVSGKKYLWHRFTRLYPLHFVTLIIIALAQYMTFSEFNQFSIYHNNNLQQFILHLGFASEWFGGGAKSFNGPVWSVSVEVFSYLLFLFLISKSLLSLRNLAVFCVLFGVFHMLIDNMVTLCMYYFFVGCFANAVFQQAQKHFSQEVIFIISAIGLFLTILVLFLPFNMPAMLPYAAAFSFLITGLVSLEYMGKMKGVSRLKWIGNTSYGNYLWHSPLQVIFIYMCGVGLIDINIVSSAEFLPAYIVAVTLISIVSYHTIERPAQRRLNNLSPLFTPSPIVR
jgi:peptidoglycan/LPS O-acetylase OafA/YrhL